MSDPVNDLENFNSEGLPVNPLAPSEVRRLGDRMRRRRNVASVVAGVAAVAVVAAPIALFAGRDDGSSPSPAPAPASSTTGSPDVTTPPSPEPINVLLREIPDGFPLASGWPDDDRAESEEQGRTGPNRRLDSLLFTTCGTTFDDPPYVDRLRAGWTNPEDYRSRQLTTYADADEAVAAVRALAEFFRACPAEDLDDDYTRRREVRPTQVGGESWALVSHLEFQGAPSISLEVIHVIRLGRAVLIDTSSNEGSLADAESQIAFMISGTEKPVSTMCVFTEAGCGDGTESIPPPATGTIGPEGYGSIKLGMTLEEVLATGEAVVSRPPGTEWCTGIRILPESSSTADDAVISQGQGVAGIFLRGAMRTPEGIGIGSTADELLAAYPDAEQPVEGSYAIPIPDHPDKQYYAFVDEHDGVSEMSLEFIDQDCYR